MKKITLKNITMVVVIIASIVYINNSTGLFSYIGETYNDLTSMWLVTMYVEGKIDTLIITDEREIEMKGHDLIRYSEYLVNRQKLAHLRVILKNSSSKTLPVKFGINFYDANDKLFLEKYPEFNSLEFFRSYSFIYLDGEQEDTLYAQYFSLPKSQIERIKRYELKVFYHKITKRKRLK